MFSPMKSMKQAFTFNSADVKLTSVSTNSDVMQYLLDVILSNRFEFFMFFSAVLGYLILFCARLPKGRVYQKRSVEADAEPEEGPPQEDDGPYTKLDQLRAETSPQPSQDPSAEPAGMNLSCIRGTLEAAHEAGNHAAALRRWGTLKHSGKEPTLPLARIVESMCSHKKDSHGVANELCSFFKQYPDVCGMPEANDVLEHLGERRDSELMELILDMLPSVGLHRDQRTYEIFLKMHVTSRDFSEVQALVADMDTNRIPLSARAVFLVMKGALQAQDFDQSFRYFRELKVTWASRDTSEPIVPQSIMMMLVNLAWEEQQLGQLVLELRDMPLPESTIDTMLTKCVGSCDDAMARSVESLARGQRTTLPDSTYNLLIKAMTHRPPRVRGIIEEVLARESSRFAPDLALSVIDFCHGASDLKVADQLFERMKPKPASVLGAFVWFYIGMEQFEKACDVYELDLQPMCSNANGNTILDGSLQESMVDAAVVCGRTHLAESLVAQTRSVATGNLAIASREAKQLIEAIIAVLARWNAVVSYWAVLIF